jgi:hypothetical protein
MQATPEPTPDPADYYSDRVDQAGARFRLAAAAAGAEVRIHAHPESGPHGEALATMVAQLKPDAPRALVVVSGTHGVEGLCGSAIQCALLEQLANHPLPSGMGLVLVHRINPWGAAWDRREDDANIDIFRNLLYRHPPFEPNELYERFEEGINPRAWEGPNANVQTASTASSCERTASMRPWRPSAAASTGFRKGSPSTAPRPAGPGSWLSKSAATIWPARARSMYWTFTPAMVGLASCG